MSEAKAIRRDTFSLASGEIVIEWSIEWSPISPGEEYMVDDWIRLVMRKMKATARPNGQCRPQVRPPIITPAPSPEAMAAADGLNRADERRYETSPLVPACRVPLAWVKRGGDSWSAPNTFGLMTPGPGDDVEGGDNIAPVRWIIDRETDEVDTRYWVNGASFGLGPAKFPTIEAAMEFCQDRDSEMRKNRAEEAEMPF